MLAHALALLAHLLAATVWVGGMAVMLFVVRPAAATLAPPQRLAFFSDALARLFTLVAGAIVVLLVSGIVMIWLAGGFGSVRWHVHTMFGLALAMIAVFGHVRYSLFPRLRRGVQAQDWAAAGEVLADIRHEVALNLGMGILVFVVALLGRAL